MSICNRFVVHTVLALSAAVTLSGAANAAVSRWDCNLVIPANTTGYFLNVDAKTYGTSNVTGWDLQIFSGGAAASVVFNAGTAAGIQKWGSPSFQAGNLPMGAVTGPASSFSLGGPYQATFSVAGQTKYEGMWNLNAVNYFGFKFIATDGFTHYGFGKMTVGANANVRTLNYLEYETVPGVGLVVPAPGALALAGLCGLAGKRRRR